MILHLGKRPNAVTHAQFIAYFLANRLFFVADRRIDGCHHNQGHVTFCLPCEIKHGTKSLRAIHAAHVFLVCFGGGRIQADGYGVNDTFKLGADVSMVDKAALPVRVDAYGQLVTALHLARNALERIESAGGLAVSAENHLFEATHVLAVECGHDLFERWFVIKP